MAFLILHGLEGSGPEHWQTWLAGRLRERGATVVFPDLPEADNPRLDRWLAALADELARLPAGETTVLCHSLGSLLWLHHAAGAPRVKIERVALVAPAQPDEDDAQSPGFRPVPLSREGIASAADQTVLVCSTDDPWCPPETSRRIALAIGVEIDWLENAGHINTDGGYGPWPGCRGVGAGPALPARRLTFRRVRARSEQQHGRAETSQRPQLLRRAGSRRPPRRSRSAT